MPRATSATIMREQCPLCGFLMDEHTVHVETAMRNGKKFLTHTGWDCPDREVRLKALANAH